MSDGSKSKSPNVKCPICKKRAVESLRPFCSKRCADVDLNRWLTGNYAIPVADEDLNEEDLMTIEQVNTGFSGTKH